MPTKTPRRSKPFIDNIPKGTEDGSNAPDQAPTTTPTPGATERKKEPLPAAKKQSRPRKLLTDDELKIEEDRLLAKYPHITTGTLHNATKDQPTDGLTPVEVHKYRHKRSIVITCQHMAIGSEVAQCHVTRRIATSDLAQVILCEEHTREARNQRKRERRATARATREAAPAAPAPLPRAAE